MRFFFAIVSSLLLAYAVSLVVTVFWNPETRFWNEAVEQRIKTTIEMREKNSQQPIIFFTGGSSCAFSIDPQVISDMTGTRAVNLGLPAAAGARYILHQALRQAQKGDLIVVCTEPDILTYAEQETGPSQTGFALEAIRGNFTDSAGGATFAQKPTIQNFLSLPRPGARYLITLAGRTITGKGYRYKVEDIRPFGLIRTDVRDASLQGMGDSEVTALHSEGREMLETFATAAKNKGVRLAYSMPWCFTKTSSLDHNRANKRKVLAEIATIMPVIEDGYSGAMDGIENFADSGLHLSDRGAAIRSKALGEALAQALKQQP